MLKWKIGLDFPLEAVNSDAHGISELRYNCIPCIVKASNQSSKTMPYLIRYNNFSQIETAIDEALIVDRSYVPEVELLTWEEISGNILQEISSTKAEKSPELSYDYLSTFRIDFIRRT